MIQTRNFGTHDGEIITEALLTSPQASVAILNYGCVVRDWRVNLRDRVIPVVLGFDEFENYPKHSPSFGIIAGRVANRTAFGRFSLHGKAYQLPNNDGVNHLHGGVLGLGRRVWKMEMDANSVQLTYHSPANEEGYPANVDFAVTFSLDGTALSCEMTAVPDAPTPINLAQHSYYNLNGAGNVREHLVQISASKYTLTNATQIPTGEIIPVNGTRYDFRSATNSMVNDPTGLGVDMNLVLDKNHSKTVPNAVVQANDLTMKLWTDEPGLQIFNAPNMHVPVPGIDGQTYGPFSGLCLEAQHFPDSLNQPDWPSIIHTPDHPYYQKLIVDISPDI